MTIDKSKIRKILRIIIYSADLVVCCIFGALYIHAWKQGEEPIIIVLSAVGVLIGMVLFSLWVYWIGCRFIKYNENNTSKETSGKA